jgi:hypothetical protein
LPGMAAANYYPVIFRAVSGLPSNTHAARLGLYGQARKALAAQPLSKRELKRELRALEHAIREVERSPDQIPGERGSTPALVFSIFFLKMLWASDPTSMALYWVIRPWNDHL